MIDKMPDADAGREKTRGADRPPRALEAKQDERRRRPERKLTAKRETGRRDATAASRPTTTPR